MSEFLHCFFHIIYDSIYWFFAEIIKDYGAVLISLGTFILALRALSQWKQQKRIALAEKYHVALWEMKYNITYEFKIAALMITQLDTDTTFILADKSYMEADKSYKEIIVLLNHKMLELRRMEAIFVDIEQDIVKFNTLCNILAGKVSEQITILKSDLKLPNRGEANKKIRNTFNDKSDEIQQLEDAYKKINDYLIKYIADGLKITKK